ncbi:related to CKI1 - choline kinase [Melanopsichium pennsylvanicum]|uniref:Related to CKI1 - choline kinase n=2 Tax=Melanopsichium pennsylvanicum TaxID=63383 RepID=A0AAJ5C7G4_9BASI|nr:related to CKI1-choline kinase [Melanopsichium pennsylvanicum 4]SNX86548.1 related to CKI1 - choline kinase [Melanopsichium pennsylvanicum]
MQQQDHLRIAEAFRTQETDVPSPVLCDPFMSPSPSPSPALSAYSYSSTSSADGFSDQDPDLNALSLEAIEEPQYRLTNAHASLRDHFGLVRGLNHAAEIDPRQSGLPSGAATPVASQSSASLRFMEASRTSSSSPNGAGLSAFSSLYRSQSPRQGSEDSATSSHLTSTDKDAISNATQQHSPPDSEDERLEREAEAVGFDALDVDEEDMHADGIPAARGLRLDARQADTLQFRETVLQLFTEQLSLVGWTQEAVDPALWPLEPNQLRLKRISGAFTNAVFFASYQLPRSSKSGVLAPPTVLLRVYGASSEALLSRRAELLILHTLSSLYEIGPHILGTFANGRVEEFYDCDPIKKEGMRDFGDREAYMLPGGSLVVKGREGRAHWVARRMNELHSVPLEVMRTVLEQGNLRGPSEKGFGRGIENHIMASSHRPRRKARQRHTPYLPDKVVASPHVYGLDSRSIMHASPAPMGSNEASPAGTLDINGNYAFAHRNSSAVSLDSLATSYNSQSSFFGDSPSLTRASSPTLSPSSATDTPSPYFPPVSNGPMSPFALAPQNRPTQKGKSSRGPYPGVWRRLKRWSREALKVVELVDRFAKTQSGAKAIAMCFAGHPSIRQELRAGSNALSTATIGPTPGNLRNTLRAIRAIDLVSLYHEVEEFKRFVRTWERREGPSRRVFAHNDAQYGNLLAIKQFNAASIAMATQPEQRTRDARSPSVEIPSIPAGMPRLPSNDNRRNSTTSAAGSQSPVSVRSKSRTRTNFKKPAPLHHRIVVIDFEYASPNPRGYDVANHFQEWRADYHHPTLAWSLTHHGSYPDAQQRRKWLRAYVEQGRLLRMGGRASKGGPAALDVPGDISLPPAVASLQYSSSGAIKGPITAERSSAPVTPGTGAAQVAALEKSSGERNRLPMSQNSSSASAMSSTIRRSSPSGSSSNDGESTMRGILGRKSSNESISSSSWQAPPSGPLRAVNPSAPSTPASCLASTSPMLDGSASPQVLALASLDASIEKEIDRLEREVHLWSPATHAVWGLWGIVFAKEELEAVLTKAKAEAEGEPVEETVLFEMSTQAVPSATCAEIFDNLRYALGRIELFRQEFRQLKELGIDAI